jgi:hypothetical protein
VREHAYAPYYELASDLALDPGAMPRERFAAMVTADHARWEAVIKASGMKLE